MTSFLMAKGLSRDFGSTLALRDLDLTLAVGERVALLGPNGAGKTTLLRLLGGSLAPDAGTVAINGLSPKDARQTPGLIGWLPERAPLVADLTVLEHLKLTASFLGLNPIDAAQQIDLLTEALNLSLKLNRLSGQLSLGSRRQAALAIALMGPPKFLLLDEPAASLDPDEVVRLRRFLNHLPKDRVVLISSHAIGEAAKVTSRALILKGGQLVATPFWAELGPDLEAGYLSLVGEHAKV